MPTLSLSKTIKPISIARASRSVKTEPTTVKTEPAMPVVIDFMNSTTDEEHPSLSHTMVQGRALKEQARPPRLLAAKGNNSPSLNRRHLILSHIEASAILKAKLYIVPKNDIVELTKSAHEVGYSVDVVDGDGKDDAVLILVSLGAGQHDGADSLVERIRRTVTQ
ncbi:hypothetical protein FA15DRAFT_657072 [Coprinopsis marcescibilis]|uniref:Uncharacterized protein n=1 Tax=Coprinopsis marcescibilis TaxID=230819 RepID=A0A5C3L435_COPMA|nr:hypothetical protein FA15DRAFT_657072 [Coprinopsis marcescibilis]